MKKRPYSVLLLVPDYAADTFGHDTVHVRNWAESAAQAVEKAQKFAQWTYEQGNPEDYHLLLCVAGHTKRYDDGQGELVKKRGYR